MESAKCIICNSSHSFKFIDEVADRFSPSNLYKIQKCICGMVMLNPRPKFNQIARHYDYKDYHPQNRSVGIFDKFYKLAQIINNRMKAKIISQHWISGNTLDYGSGDGQFQNYMSQKGWNADIYEPYLKPNIIRGDSINDINKINDNYYHVITMFHSLEHIHEIDIALEKINNCLLNNGVLVIAIPNYDAYERKFFKEKWIAYDAPRHLYHFNSVSVKKILEKNNFKIIDCKPMYLDTFYNILMSTNNKFISFFKIIYLTLISFYNIYRDNTQCSSMILVCKKNEN
tara:strand:- start:374 stop:1231 length:858 start_codon:yes stop_codon:yes gene_type:complete